VPGKKEARRKISGEMGAQTYAQIENYICRHITAQILPLDTAGEIVFCFCQLVILFCIIFFSSFVCMESSPSSP